MSQKIYHISNPIQFLAQPWPLPANSLVFWSQAGAGGVLLFAGVHYIASGTGQITFSLPGLKAGDLISVVTFSGTVAH